MSDDTRQARIAAAMDAYLRWCEEHPIKRPMFDMTEQVYAQHTAAMGAALDAADAIGRERVNEDTLDRLRSWAEFFAPFVEDDNRWYGEDHMDGRDAGEVGELLQELQSLLTAAPAERGDETGGQRNRLPSHIPPQLCDEERVREALEDDSV